MTRIRHNTPSLGRRIASAREQARTPGYVPGPGADCTGNALGERLGIAALHAGRGEADAARAAALLVVAGLTDTPRNREAVQASFASIRHVVHVAVSGACA